MTSAIEGLEPKLVWKYFYEISQIPRESGNEEAVGDFIISVAEHNNLVYQKDLGHQSSWLPLPLAVKEQDIVKNQVCKSDTRKQTDVYHSHSH